MARGRAEDHVGPHRIDEGFNRLLRFCYRPVPIVGWDAIRTYLRDLGVCPPDGPSRAAMRQWAREKRFPVHPGKGKRLPWTDDLFLNAWALTNYPWRTRRSKRD